MAKKLNDNLYLFDVETTCPVVRGTIRLKSSTFSHHITRQHPEVGGDVGTLRNGIVRPSYVAASKPGPGGKYSANVVFVDRTQKIGSSSLHIFVEQNEDCNEVSTALYSKELHGEILWISSSSSTGDDDAEG